MRFKIIDVEHSHFDKLGWKEDYKKVYLGPLDGFVAGFNFEVKNKDGEYNYTSCHFMEEHPDDYINNLHYDYFDSCRYNGWEPTGRAVFRGYGIEKWNPEERDWYVEEIAIPENAKKEGIVKILYQMFA